MSKHTAEPWQPFADICEPYSQHPDSDGFVRMDFDDYRRAKACVDACRGLETETLEEKGLICAVGDQLIVLDAERDQLRAALLKYEEAFDTLFGSCCSNGVFNAWGKAVDCTALNEAHNMAGKALRLGGDV